MRLFLTLSFLFFAGSCIGWILELFYRRFFSAKRWLNPGFLVGPYLPLYGCGLCLLFVLASIDLSAIPFPLLRNALLIILMGLAMTAIEFLAGKIFIIGMNVKLWDYSDKKGNIQGVICPEFSLYWTILGAIYYYLLHPLVNNAVGWLFNNLAFSFIIGFFFGIFVIDLTYSLNLLTRIRALAKEYNITVKLEELKKTIDERREGRKFFRFLFAFSPRSLKEHLHEYNERRKNYTEKLVQKIKHRK